MYNITGIIANNFANSILNCYKFKISVESYTQTRWAAFSDFEDMYISFLFNLLAQSL
jgi:hypothetical protein